MATTLVVALLALNVATHPGSCSKSDILSYKGPNYGEKSLDGRPVELFTLEIPIVFGGITYTTLYVNFGGVISFQNSIPGHFSYDSRRNIFERHDVVAPFFTKIDMGTLSWWNSSNATVISNFQNSILNDTEPLAGYEPKLILVATWDEEEDGNHTVFQVILSTDGNVSFSKFVYHYLNNNEKDHFIGFNRKNPPRLLTLALGQQVLLSSCQIESFSQWFRIDTLDSNITSSAASCSPLNNATPSTSPVTADDVTLSTQLEADMSPSTGFESEVMPLSSTAGITATLPNNAPVSTHLMAALFSIFGIIMLAVCIISTSLVVYFTTKSQQLKSMEQKKNLGGYLTPAWSSHVNIDHILNSSHKEPCRRASRTSVITALDVFHTLDSVTEDFNGVDNEVEAVNFKHGNVSQENDIISGRSRPVTLTMNSEKEITHPPLTSSTSSNDDTLCTTHSEKSEEGRNVADGAIDIAIVEENEKQKLSREASEPTICSYEKDELICDNDPTEGDNDTFIITSSSSNFPYCIHQESNEDSGIGSHGAVSHNLSLSSFPDHLSDTEDSTRMNSNSITTTNFLPSLGSKDFLQPPSEKSENPYISNAGLKIDSEVSNSTCLEGLELDDTLWDDNIPYDHSF